MHTSAMKDVLRRSLRDHQGNEQGATTLSRSLRWVTFSTGPTQGAPSRLILLARNSLGPKCSTANGTAWLR